MIEASTFKYGRSWAELVKPGGTKIRFHHPCGHTSTVDYGKKPVAKRMGAEGCRMMARWWSKERGGVIAPCTKCFPSKKRSNP